jgi:hypothetical protein
VERAIRKALQRNEQSNFIKEDASKCALSKGQKSFTARQQTSLEGTRMLDSLKDWRAYFIQNSENKGDFNWYAEDLLTGEEKDCVGKSIAAFQLGEHSEGKGLMKAADSFARRNDNAYLSDITRLFIAEEQNHALLLRKFMELNGIPLLKRNWTDSIFRRLRKNVGFELSITVLIAAEIISLVYYDALKGGTKSSLLKSICSKILSDERIHVKYESEILNSIRQTKSTFHRVITSLLHRFLFLGTVFVVYVSHRKVLNRGRYDFANFVAACWLEFSNCFPSALVERASASA